MEHGREPILDNNVSKCGIDLSVVQDDLSLTPKVQGVLFRKCS